MAKLNDSPFEIAGPEEKAPMSPMRDEPAAGGAIPGYLEPHQRCGLCEYFDDSSGAGMCEKFRKPCDPDGGCPSFEEAGMEEEYEGGEEEMEEGDDD